MSLVFIQRTVTVTRLDLNIVTTNMILCFEKDVPYWDGLGTFYVMLNNRRDVGLLYVSRVLTVFFLTLFTMSFVRTIHRNKANTY